MSYPIPPGNRTKPMDPRLRWFEQSDRALRGLWWIEQLAFADEIEPFQIAEMREALETVLDTFGEREKREARKARITQLENTAGRTPEEAELYRAKAHKMRMADAGLASDADHAGGPEA